MNKNIKYILFIAGGLLVLFKSVYFKPLDEIKAEAAAKMFEPKAYSKDFWENKLIPNLDRAIDLNELMDLLRTNPEEAFTNHSNALGIGNIRYFLVRGTANISSIQEDHMVFELSPNRMVRLATDYIFGNAIRDASGQIDINEFTNTMDFNNVSSEINQIVVKTVLPDFILYAKEGDLVSFHGAIELNQKHIVMDRVEIIPIQLSIQNTAEN